MADEYQNVIAVWKQETRDGEPSLYIKFERDFKSGEAISVFKNKYKTPEDKKPHFVRREKVGEPTAKKEEDYFG